MKRFETFVGCVLVGFFVYSLVELLFGSSGCLEESPTFFVPLRVNTTAILLGFFISGLAVIFFPLWSVGKYLNTMNVREIMNYRLRYKADFALIVVGYIGLITWCRVHTMYGLVWWYGALCIVLCISLIARRK